MSSEVTTIVIRLLALLGGRVPPAGLDWLARATSSAAEIPGEGRRAALLSNFAAVPRRLGKGPVAPSDEERMAWFDLPISEGATVDELGRSALLAAACSAGNFSSCRTPTFARPASPRAPPTAPAGVPVA